MSQYARRPEDRSESREETPAEVFGVEDEAVAVSRATPIGDRRDQKVARYGMGGFGGQRPTADLDHFELKYPRQAIGLDGETRIVTTAYNQMRDSWEIVTETPR